MSNLSTVIEFGVLLLPDYQWLDAAGPIDYLNNHNRSLLELLRFPLAITSKAPIIRWHYISHDMKPVQATSGPLQPPTSTYADCPRLDHLLIPGPDPMAALPHGCAEFLKARVEGELKALLLICTGSIAIASTGLLNGLNVCSNKIALKIVSAAGQLNKDVKWARNKRWVVDGKVWSSAGITAGIDLGAEFARVHFDKEIIELVKEIMEYQPKPDEPDDFAYLLDGLKF